MSNSSKIANKKRGLTAKTKMLLVLESLGLNAALEAIKATKRIKNPNQQAEKWLEIHKFVEAPQAKLALDMTTQLQPITIQYTVKNKVTLIDDVQIIDTKELEISKELNSNNPSIEND